MLVLREIAVFILGTTSFFHGQSSYESRLMPSMMTWGMNFPKLYAVFGSSLKDHRYLSNRGCSLSLGSTIESNLETYECPVITMNHKLKVLRFLNCSSGYYGDGPTCR
jgi:hypothetical protein